MTKLYVGVERLSTNELCFRSVTVRTCHFAAAQCLCQTHRRLSEPTDLLYKPIKSMFLETRGAEGSLSCVYNIVALCGRYVSEVFFRNKCADECSCSMTPWNEKEDDGQSGTFTEKLLSQDHICFFCCCFF